MKNIFEYEGICRKVEERVSARGTKYWIVALESDKTTVEFVFFKLEPFVGNGYGISGYLGRNEKGYLRTTVENVTVLPGSPVQRQEAATAAQQAPDEDGDLPF